MKYTLTAICLSLLAANSQAALVYQATLQDDAASTTIVAATGTNGTLLGGDNTITISEDVGPGGSYTKALHFDNAADYIDIGTDANFPTGTGARTICFWMNADSFSGSTTDRCVDYTSSAGGTGAQFIIFAEDNAISVGFSGHRVKSTTTALSTGTWYHIAVVVPSGATTTADVDIYINGTVQSLFDEAGSSQTLNTTTADVLLAASATPADYYDGYMADFRIYDSDESANLATIMADGQDSTGIVPLIHYYRQMMGR